MDAVIEAGYRPGIIGLVSALQARYYAREWSFGPSFEAKVAQGISELVLRYDPAHDLLLSAWDGDRLLGTVTIDGGDPRNPPRTAHLRWFIVDAAARGAGLGRRLISRAVEFARASGQDAVYLWTFDGLRAARKLYDDAGFVLVEQHVGTTWGTAVTEQRFELRL
jgi:GNAT superfamily N-acetyltransferase